MKIVRIAFVLCCLTGCHIGPKGDKNDEGQISKAHAKILAVQQFSKLYPGSYNQYSIKISEDRVVWYVWFENRSKFPKFGDYYVATVSKSDGAIEITPGK
jgi:hypothetical protein